VDDEALIREQIQFYREAAPYYGHAFGPADDAFNDRVLAYCPASRHCVELASGSGRWTTLLLGKCERITAVDSSPERHALSQARIADPRVEYVEADLFRFRPPAKYDLVLPVPGSRTSRRHVSNRSGQWSQTRSHLIGGS